jgi:Mce-associated membrane protein
VSDDDNTDQNHDVETAPDETAPVDEAGPDVEPTVGVEIDKSADATDAAPAPGRSLRAVPVIPAVLVLALLAAGGLAAWMYFSQYRPDQATDQAASQSAIDAARDGTVAMLSYKPGTLDQDFAAAKSHLTGDFLNYYDTFTKQIVSPAAKDKAVTTTAQVVGAAATELHPKSAVVLVFVNQVTTSKERPDPSAAASSVLVSLTKVQGSWLINKFDPV